MRFLIVVVSISAVRHIERKLTLYLLKKLHQDADSLVHFVRKNENRTEVISHLVFRKDP